MSKPIAVALVILAFIGAGTIHGLSVSNGFFEMVTESKLQGVLPFGVTDPYDSKFTGIEPIDYMLSHLVVFFWPVVEGGSERAGLNVMGFLFGGQSCAAVTIMLIEGMRKGNDGRLVSWISIYSILIQLSGFALAAPIYLTIYVLTSPTFFAPTTENLIVSNIDAIPFGLVLGFIVPSVAMALPYPSILSLKQKIWSIVLWQPSPLYAIYISKILSSLSPHKAKTTSIPRQLMHLRAAYKFALLVSVPVHIITWTLSLSSVLVPSLFSPQTVSALHPLNAIIPQNPFSTYNTQAADVAQGALWFLQWDFWVTASAYLVFAVGAKYTALQTNPLRDIIGILGKTLLLGPMGAALMLLWERDEIVLGKPENEKKKAS